MSALRTNCAATKLLRSCAGKLLRTCPPGCGSCPGGWLTPTTEMTWEDLSTSKVEIKFAGIAICGGCQFVGIDDGLGSIRWGWASNVRVTGAALEGLIFCFEPADMADQFKEHPTAKLAFDFYESESETPDCTGTPETFEASLYCAIDGIYGEIFLHAYGLADNSVFGALFTGDPAPDILPSQNQYPSDCDDPPFSHPNYLTGPTGTASVRYCPPEEEP
jgi:hypothetical protein